MFSPAEEKVIEIIGKRKITIHRIAEKFYLNYEDFQPLDPENYIGLVVRRISKKCRHYKLKWTIVGSRSVKGRTVWRMPLKSKRA